MAPPRIGIVTYGRDDEGRFTLPVEYVDSVRRAGGLPLLLPPGEPDLAAWMALLDGLILAGGGDLDPKLYAGRPHPENYKLDHDRDANELWLARRARASRLPTLGICRGMQVLNVAFGGTLIEHLPDDVGDAVAHRSPGKEPVPHEVAMEPGTALARLLDAGVVRATSWHHQAVRALAEGFRIAGRTADGVIEAMELPEHPWLVAVQWHPELTAKDDPVQQRLFDALVAAADGNGDKACD